MQCSWPGSSLHSWCWVSTGQAAESRVKTQVIDLALAKYCENGWCGPGGQSCSTCSLVPVFVFTELWALCAKYQTSGRGAGAVAWVQHRPVLPGSTPVRYSYTVRIIMARKADQFIQSSLATGFPTSSLMSWVLVISHTVTGCETVMPCEHTDTFSHILLFITLSITLSTFPFIWKVPSSVRDDACGEWGETGGDSEGHEMCQDRSLAPAPCCGQPWPRVRQGRVNESGPTIDLAPSPVSWYRSPHTTLASLTQMGIIPAAFCQVSMALWLYEKLLLPSWQLPL